MTLTFPSFTLNEDLACPADWKVWCVQDATNNVKQVRLIVTHGSITAAFMTTSDSEVSNALWRFHTSPHDHVMTYTSHNDLLDLKKVFHI